MLFHSVLARFFAIPVPQPVAGRISMTQMRAMWALDVARSATLGGLAERLGVSSSTAAETVDRLVAGKFIRRARSRDDRRQVDLSLLPKGRAVLSMLARQRKSRFEKLLRVLSRSESERMEAALETVNGALGKWNGR